MSRPRVRVALLATTVHFGGIERVLLTLLEHMDADIELVPVLFTRTDTQERSFVNRLHALGVRHETIYVNTARRVRLSPLRDLRAALAVFRKHQFDLVHCHGYRADVLGLAVSKCLRLPLVSTCHGFITNDRRLQLYNRLDVFLLRYFTRVIAVSAAMKNELVASGVNPEKVHVITNVVGGTSQPDRETRRRITRSRLGLADADFVFGYVGRLSREKGLIDLLHAAAMMAAGGSSGRMLVVGDGSERATLEHAARDLGISQRVDFAGFQSDTSDWYAAMDAFVLPSLTEGTPLALLEAMAYGLPVIATAVGGVPNVVSDGENGLLVPAANAARLATAMQALSADAALRSRLADAGRRWVQERHDVQRWIRDVRGVYVSTLQDRRGAA